MKRSFAAQCRKMKSLGEFPQICVPFMGKDLEELQWEAELLEGCQKSLRPKIVQWCAEYFTDLTCPAKLRRALLYLRGALPDMVLVFSCRRKAGSRFFSEPEYYRLYSKVLQIGNVDYLDLEYPVNPLSLNCLMERALRQGVGVMLSYRQSQGPYQAKELAEKQKEMEKAGACFTRIIINGQSIEDLLELLRAGQQIRQAGHCPGALLSFARPEEKGGLVLQDSATGIFYKNLWLDSGKDRELSAGQLLELWDHSLELDGAEESCCLFLTGGKPDFRKEVARILGQQLGFEELQLPRRPSAKGERIFAGGNVIVQLSRTYLRKPELLKKLRQRGVLIRLTSEKDMTIKGSADFNVAVRGLEPAEAARKILIYLNGSCP